MKDNSRKRSAKKSRTEVFSSSMPRMLSQTGSISARLYSDLRVPLDIFLDCLYDQDYSRLLLFGKATEDQLFETWNKIYLLYSNEISGGNDNPIVFKIKEIEELNAKITFVHGAVNHLRLNYDQELVNALNYWGLQCDLKPEDDPYEKLNRVVAMAKLFVIQMGEARTKLTQLQEVQNEESTRDTFDETIISISKYQGYAVKPTEITVGIYLKTMKRMEKFYQQQIQHANAH